MKEKKPFYKKWWVWAIAVFIILGIALSPSEEERAEIEAQEAAAQAKLEEENKQKEEQKKAEEKAKAEEEKQKEVEKQSQIVAFNLASEELVKNSNGIIHDISLTEESNFLQVNVFVDEIVWAGSNESEKKSFATTIGTSIENALSPHSTYVDIRSATNNDVVASQKLFGGWEIKR